MAEGLFIKNSITGKTVNSAEYDILSISVAASGDTLLPYTLPAGEYMFGCSATAVGMLLGYYDLYGYQEYSFKNIIDGTPELNARGLDGNAYDMDAFDTILGRFIASTGYKNRFYNQNSNTEKQYTFINGDPAQGLNFTVFDSLADWIGTGQYWRGNSDLSTTVYYTTLAKLYNTSQHITINGETIPIKYADLKWGVDQYLQTKGYKLDRNATRTVQTDNASGSFTFADYKAEIDAGRPVLISISSGSYGHMMTGYGYNSATNEIIFDDTYRSGQRMTWNGTYEYSGRTYTIRSITTIVLDTSGMVNTPEILSADITNDVNGDGISDIVMINSDRDAGVWLMDEYGGAKWLPLSSLPRTWDIYAVTNLNGDKYADILLYDAANGDIGAWYTDANGVPEWESLLDMDADEDIAASADVNGDGMDEIITRYADGRVKINYLRNSGKNSEIFLDPEWQITASGDISGDGTEDIILRKDNTIAAWIMKSGEAALVELGEVDTVNIISGTGDFNGDGTADILFDSNGSFGAWLMQKGQVTAWKALGDHTSSFEAVIDINGDNIDDLRFRNGNELTALLVTDSCNTEKTIGTVPGDWRTKWPKKPAAAAKSDISGDGIADIVMINSDNYGGAWVMDAKGKPVWQPLSGLPGSWDIFDVRNLNGDQFADILLYDKQNGQLGAWLLNAAGNPSWLSLGSLNQDTILAAAADVTGDGITDMICRREDSSVIIKTIDGNPDIVNSCISSCELAAAGDINGDGTDDIIFRDGDEISAWIMQDGFFKNWIFLPEVDAANIIAGTGDFNGDGTDDILFNTNGSWGAWLMQNGTATAWKSIENIPEGAVLESISDCNGDGIDDLRFRLDNTIAVARVGENSTRWQIIGDVPDNWRTDLGGLA